MNVSKSLVMVLDSRPVSDSSKRTAFIFLIEGQGLIVSGVSKAPEFKLGFLCHTSVNIYSVEILHAR